MSRGQHVYDLSYLDHSIHNDTCIVVAGKKSQSVHVHKLRAVMASCNHPCPASTAALSEPGRNLFHFALLA
jgi:hypothetical protein